MYMQDTSTKNANLVIFLHQSVRSFKHKNGTTHLWSLRCQKYHFLYDTCAYYSISCNFNANFDQFIEIVAQIIHKW